MKLTQYQVDAFAQKVFEGNPAAVCPLDNWLPEHTMQSIAAENNVAETAFFVQEGENYHIRWFTPEVEVDLCGHATLASAYVLYNELGYSKPAITFNSKSGTLNVLNCEGLFILDFPAEPPEDCEVPQGLSEALGVKITRCMFNQDYVVVLESEQELLAITPNIGQLKKVAARGIIVTAPAEKYDFVNRFFGPNVGINEDPVTGSAFTKLIPFWANELSKTKLSARQVSNRGGDVFCELRGDRVDIAGHATLFFKGDIYL